jgi:predicted nucleic acid-binding protein
MRFMTARCFADTNLFAYWDAAIVAAARKLGCETLYSEDLNRGQDYGGVIVRNPFTSV